MSSISPSSSSSSSSSMNNDTTEQTPTHSMTTRTTTLDLRKESSVSPTMIANSSAIIATFGPIDLTTELALSLPSTLQYLDWDVGHQQNVPFPAIKALLDLPCLNSLGFKCTNRQAIGCLVKALRRKRGEASMDNNNNNTTSTSTMELFMPLRHLYLPRNGVRSSDVMAMLPSLRCLRSLYLGDNHIGNAGAIEIANVLLSCTTKSSGHLQRLDLRRNRIRNTGATALATALATNRSLQELHLNGNVGISTTTIFTDCLERNHILRRLDLSKTSVAWSERLDYLLHLNRHGRRLVACDDLPMGCWATYLSSRHDLDAVYYTLLERPDLVPNCTSSSSSSSNTTTVTTS